VRQRLRNASSTSSSSRILRAACVSGLLIALFVTSAACQSRKVVAEHDPGLLKRIPAPALKDPTWAGVYAQGVRCREVVRKQNCRLDTLAGRPLPAECE
jgi:hypothetical protein